MSFFMLWMRTTPPSSASPTTPSTDRQDDRDLLCIGATDVRSWPRGMMPADCRRHDAAGIEDGLARMAPTLPKYVTGVFPAGDDGAPLGHPTLWASYRTLLVMPAGALSPIDDGHRPDAALVADAVPAQPADATGVLRHALMAAMRRSAQPMFVVREDLTVMWRNDAAATVVSTGMLGLQGQRLITRGSAAHIGFRQTVRAVCQSSEAGDTEVARPVTLNTPDGRSSSHGWIIPLGPGWSSHASGILAALVVIDRTLQRQPDPNALRSAYGLTNTEASVAGDLLRGQSPHDIASQRQVSLNTVRTQIRRVLEKSGNSRIPEFVSAVFNAH